jgi:hypothetical protein
MTKRIRTPQIAALPGMTPLGINPNAPTWFNQLRHARLTLRDQGYAELKRHASVSLDNRHYCHECFCCACVDILREYDREPDKKRYLGSIG